MTDTFEDPFHHADPFDLFEDWMALAARTETNDPTAMSIATADETGMPNVRMVLLKRADPQGFVFYTNLESRKGRELAANKGAALCIYWATLHRQVRVRGPIEPVSDEEADAYFHSRHRQSQIGAWASKQSEPLASRAVMMDRVKELEDRYGDREIPRPGHWSGFRVWPMSIEFWHQGDYRLHDRIQFTRDVPESDEWTRVRLYP